MTGNNKLGTVNFNNGNQYFAVFKQLVDQCNNDIRAKQQVKLAKYRLNQINERLVGQTGSGFGSRSAKWDRINNLKK